MSDYNSIQYQSLLSELEQRKLDHKNVVLENRKLKAKHWYQEFLRVEQENETMKQELDILHRYFPSASRGIKEFMENKEK